MQPLPPAVAEQIESVFDDQARLRELTERILREHPDMGGERFTDAELEQVLRGFAGLAKEALHGGGETRAFFLETAIPAVVAQGETPASIARSSTLFGVLLADEVCSSLEGDDRAAAVAWLARFFGDYSFDAVTAAAR